MINSVAEQQNSSNIMSPFFLDFQGYFTWNLPMTAQKKSNLYVERSGLGSRRKFEVKRKILRPEAYVTPFDYWHASHF